MATAPPSATWRRSFPNGFTVDDAGSFILGTPCPGPGGALRIFPLLATGERREGQPAWPCCLCSPPGAPGPAACGSGSPGPPTLVCSTAYDNGCRTLHPGHLAKEVTPGSISAPLPLGISLALTALALSHMLLTFSDISQAVSPWKTGQ